MLGDNSFININFIMRHLIWSFLVFSVNSFPQDLHGRFEDDLELAYNSANPDSSIFAEPTSVDGSSDLFATAGDSQLYGSDNLPELSSLDTLDSTETSLGPPNPALKVAEWHDHPDYAELYGCDGGLGLACCFAGGACIWFNGKEPHCYYEEDLRCCRDIGAGEVGIDCGPATPKNQVGVLPTIGQTVEDILRIEVPTGWLAPLVGGSAWQNR